MSQPVFKGPPAALQLPRSAVFGPPAALRHGHRAALHAEALKRLHPEQPLLPIEFLKLDPAALEAEFNAPPVHYFLSSGTTMRDRSRSSFSQLGLSAYHQTSLHSFEAMLESFFAPGARPRGISLIPPTSEWTNSSLAQMVAWIGNVWPLTYWDGEGEAPELTEPVWVFATGFHIVAFADAGRTLKLPPGSIVIETGGTKGKTRSVTREESYSLIEKAFGVDRNHIVSEYGMCELASQAYDWVQKPKGPILPLDERWFRFPVWAPTRILKADLSIAEEGEGTLIVDDQMRIDLSAPLRTEDRARLRADGSFQILGRVAFSTLKGCSLLAEDLLRQSTARPTSMESIATESLALPTLERSAHCHALVRTLLQNDRFAQILMRRIGSHPEIKSWMMDDLKASVPASPEAWLDAAREAKARHRRWLFIPPHTHDLALLQPLFLAALLDLKVTVRAADDDELLNQLEALFEGFWSFDRIDPSWRLEAGADQPWDAILVFGSDETVQTIRSVSQRAVQGFGHWLTASVISQKSLTDEGWKKDALSLAQQGCLSSRLLCVWREDTETEIPLPHWVFPSLSMSESQQLAHAALELAIQNYQLPHVRKPSEILLAEKRWSPSERLADQLSARPFSLPVLRLSATELPDLIRQLESEQAFQQISLDAASARGPWNPGQLVLGPLGKANQSPWNGRHNGRPLFFAE